MLIVLREEFDSTPLYCVEEEIYKKIRAKFIALLMSEAIADALLQKFWKKTLREMSCNNIVDIMDCFTLL